MTARSVAEYLMRFAPPDGVEPALDLCAAIGPAPIWTQEPEEDRESALNAARESGRAAGLEEARAEFAVVLDGERQAFEQRLMAERQRWLREEAEQLRERLAAAVRNMEESIGDCVARVLRPFVIDSLRRQMVEDLIDHIATMIGSNEKIAIKIAGPADLLASLRDKLASIPAAIEYEPQDRVDIVVVAEQTAIETQLEAWLNLIASETE
jgi:hypothetical protein